MGDEVDDSGSPSELDDSEDQELDSEAGDEESDDEESEGDPESAKRKIPYGRFKQVNDKAKRFEQQVKYYAEHVGSSPEEIAEFKKWKQAKLKDAEKANDKGEISAERLAAIKKLVRQSDPELDQIIENTKAKAKAAEEATFDEATELVEEYAQKEFGFSKKDTRKTTLFGVQVMQCIKTDPSLMRKWQAGRVESAVKTACAIVDKEMYGGPEKRSKKNPADNLSIKREIKKLPIMPRGGSAGLSGKGKQAEEEKGLTKQSHDDAWALVQQALGE